MIRVFIPSYHKVEAGGDSFTAYRIEIFQNGKQHILNKRYSEFEELHKQLKKVLITPEFPPKKVLKFQHKVMEQRRVILENYMQGILEGDSIPRSFFKFLQVELPRTGSFDSLEVGTSGPAASHQPMVGFSADAFLQENYKSFLPDIISQGVTDGLYATQPDDMWGIGR